MEERIKALEKELRSIEKKRDALKVDDHMLHVAGLALHQEIKDLKEIVRLQRKRGV